MDNLERWFWLKYQEQIPMEYEIYRNRIDQILEDGKSEKFKIVTLNDNLRILGIGWKVMATRWFNELSQGIKKEVFDLIWNFSDFNLDNDPYWEHDFWKVQLDDTCFLFKIDYYDKTEKYWSEYTSNPSITHRIMTIMLANEY